MQFELDKLDKLKTSKSLPLGIQLLEVVPDSRVITLDSYAVLIDAFTNPIKFLRRGLGSFKDVNTWQDDPRDGTDPCPANIILSDACQVMFSSVSGSVPSSVKVLVLPDRDSVPYVEILRSLLQNKWMNPTCLETIRKKIGEVPGSIGILVDEYLRTKPGDVGIETETEIRACLQHDVQSLFPGPIIPIGQSTFDKLFRVVAKDTYTTRCAAHESNLIPRINLALKTNSVNSDYSLFVCSDDSVILVQDKKDDIRLKMRRARIPFGEYGPLVTWMPIKYVPDLLYTVIGEDQIGFTGLAILEQDASFMNQIKDKVTSAKSKLQSDTATENVEVTITPIFVQHYFCVPVVVSKGIFLNRLARVLKANDGYRDFGKNKKVDDKKDCVVSRLTKLYHTYKSAIREVFAKTFGNEKIGLGITLNSGALGRHQASNTECTLSDDFDLLLYENMIQGLPATEMVRKNAASTLYKRVYKDDRGSMEDCLHALVGMLVGIYVLCHTETTDSQPRNLSSGTFSWWVANSVVLPEMIIKKYFVCDWSTGTPSPYFPGSVFAGTKTIKLTTAMQTTNVVRRNSKEAIKRRLARHVSKGFAYSMESSSAWLERVAETVSKHQDLRNLVDPDEDGSDRTCSASEPGSVAPTGRSSVAPEGEVFERDPINAVPDDEGGWLGGIENSAGYPETDQGKSDPKVLNDGSRVVSTYLQADAGTVPDLSEKDRPGKATKSDREGTSPVPPAVTDTAEGS